MRQMLLELYEVIKQEQAEILEFYNMRELYDNSQVVVNTIEAVFGYNTMAVEKLETIIDTIEDGEC